MTSPKPSSVAYPLEPALHFLQRFWQLNHAIEKLSSRMEKYLGVTAQQRFVLRCVGKYPGLTAGQLASILHVDPGTVSASLRRLERKELLARRRDPRDQRRASLGVTPTGRELDQPTPGTLESAVTRFLDGCTEQELETMARFFKRLTTEIQEETANEVPHIP